MAQVVVSSGTLMCSMGLSPGVINGTSNLTVMAEGKPICLLSDVAPKVNISGFGMCTSPANPAVAAATAAAMGVPTPAPCLPVITGTWIPAGNTKVIVGGLPALTLGCTCVCAYAGSINIVNPGQVSVSAG